MKMTWTFLVASLATAGIANAAELNPIDLNALSPEPLTILDALAPERHDNEQARRGKEGRWDKDDKKPAMMPKACTDAAITDDQKTAIETAVYEAARSKVQAKADLKLAMMDFAHIVSDKTTEKAAADAVGVKISDGVQKLVAGHIALSTKILYDIVTPDQRKNTFMCMVAMHKMKKGHRRGHY